MPLKKQKRASGGSRTGSTRKSGRQVQSRVPRMKYTSMVRSKVVSVPNSIGVIENPLTMNITSVGANRITIRNREPFYRVVLPTAAVLEAHISVNPGVSTQFPWLSKLSRAYDKYNWKKLDFVYSSGMSASTFGEAVISPDYDPMDPNPLDSYTARQSVDSVSGPVWTPMTCHVTNPRRNGDNGLFLRHAAVGPGEDTRLMDALKLHMYFTAPSTAVAIVWADYEIELFFPDCDVNDTTVMYLNTTGNLVATTAGTNPLSAKFLISAAGGLNTLVNGVYDVLSVQVPTASANCTVTDKGSVASSLTHLWRIAPIIADVMVVAFPGVVAEIVTIFDRVFTESWL